MRKLIVMTLVVIALAVLFLAGIRDEPVIFVDTQGGPDSPNVTTQSNAEQLRPSHPRNTESDAQILNEDAIVINWHERPHRKFVFPNGTPLENYEYYNSLAESGNGLAAYQLVEMMSSCNHAFLGREELDEAVAQMRNTFTYYDPKLDAEVRIGEPERVNEYIEHTIKHFETCKDFTAIQREEHEMWLELASNNGHTTAMLEYGRQLDDPAAAVELYRSAWLQGDGEALRSLAEGLEQMYDEGIDPSAKIPAYAAMYAFVTLLRTAHGANPDRVVGRRTLRNQAKLDEMAREMLRDELETAVELSRELITSNKNCCYSM